MTHLHAQYSPDEEDRTRGYLCHRVMQAWELAKAAKSWAREVVPDPKTGMETNTKFDEEKN
jgi:hypothetical protein